MGDEATTEASEASDEMHRIYIGRRHRGNRLYLYGKCSCGETLDDEDAIGTHREQHEGTAT